jgi:hypothetical protein
MASVALEALRSIAEFSIDEKVITMWATMKIKVARIPFCLNGSASTLNAF